jgi:acetolactate synthase-1/2/3 large subunit
VKAAELVARFLEEKGLRHVFGISGGASLHLIHGIADVTQIKFIPPQNEQAASFQADAYARLSGFGCALATSGPGASNLVTGIATSYYDSVPVLYLTGNQARGRMVGDTGCRQIGFQETPIVDIVRKITKYAVTVMHGSQLLPCLETAYLYATLGRPGPVLVDIPDDLQREDINV